MQKRPKNLDLNQLAKRIVDEAVGDEPIEPSPAEKNQAAIDKGRLDDKLKSKMGKSKAKSIIR